MSAGNAATTFTNAYIDLLYPSMKFADHTSGLTFTPTYPLTITINNGQTNDVMVRNLKIWKEFLNAGAAGRWLMKRMNPNWHPFLLYYFPMDESIGS